jgi:hypothetical protein
MGAQPRLATSTTYQNGKAVFCKRLLYPARTNSAARRQDDNASVCPYQQATTPQFGGSATRQRARKRDASVRYRASVLAFTHQVGTKQDLEDVIDPSARSAAHHPSARCVKCSNVRTGATQHNGSGGKSVLNEARQHGTIPKTRQQRPSGCQGARRIRLPAPQVGRERGVTAGHNGLRGFMAFQVARKRDLAARQ